VDSASSARRLGKSLDVGERAGDRDEQTSEGVHGEAEVSAAERYLAGGLALHFHYRVRRTKAFVEADSRDLCAVFNSAERLPPGGFRRVLDQVALGPNRARSEADPGDVEVDIETVDNAVLVNVPEGVEVVEALRHVPSLVRLQPLQYCDGVFVQEPKNSMRLEPSRIAGDGKGDLPGSIWLPELLDRIGAACEQPRRLVKRRPGVMDDIADHKPHPPVVNRLGLGAADAHDVASGLVIELIDNTKRLRIHPKFALTVENFQLLDCPVQLCSRPL
jgi:hypothetical protein